MRQLIHQTEVTESSKTQQRTLLVILSFAEFWDVFSFFGTTAVIILYTTTVFGFSDQLSYTIYGIYLALLCGLPVVGGLLADRLFGYYRSIIYGVSLLIFGNLCLLIQCTNFLYFGLAGTIVGTSLYKTTCTSLVGTLYENNPKDKEKAYTFFYAIMNCGAVFGPIVYGIIAKFFGWHTCFLFSAIGLTFCLFIFVTKKVGIRKMSDHGRKLGFLKNSLHFLFVGVFLFIITLIFLLSRYFDNVFFALVILVLVMLNYLLIKQKVLERKHLCGVLVLIFFCIFFFSASLQVGSSLTLFLDRNVLRVLLGWKIPTTFFTSLDPLFVVLFAPVFTFIWCLFDKNGRGVPATIKLALGLIIGGVGFLCFWLSAQLIGMGYQSIVLLVLLCGYIFIGAGEICLTPAILRAISDHSPKNLVSTMNGAWYLSMSFAGYIGSVIAKVGSSIDIVGTNYTHFHRLAEINSFAHIFLLTAIITISAAVILFSLSRMINKLF